MWEPAESDFKAMVIEKIRGNHFMHEVGFQIDQINPGQIEGHLDLMPHHLQQMGFVHGGVTATIADIVAGFAAFTLVKKGQGVVTVEMKVSYLNPGKGEQVFARGWVLKTGQKLHFCESELWTMNGPDRILIAKASATMATVNPAEVQR